MRKLVKSLGTLGTASVFFGLEQASKAIRGKRGGTRRVAAAVDVVARSMADELGGTLRESFYATDRLQQQMIDATLDTVSRAPDRGATRYQPLRELLTHFARRARHARQETTDDDRTRDIAT